MLPEKIQKVMRESNCYGDRELGISYLNQTIIEVAGVQKKLACIVVIVANLFIEKNSILRELASICLEDLRSEHTKVRINT